MARQSTHPVARRKILPCRSLFVHRLPFSLFPLIPPRVFSLFHLLRLTWEARFTPRHPRIESAHLRRIRPVLLERCRQVFHNPLRCLYKFLTNYLTRFVLKGKNATVFLGFLARGTS